MSTPFSKSHVPPNLLSLPLDIHLLILEYLDVSDIFKLRSLSHTSYKVFTSKSICNHYLLQDGVYPKSSEDTQTEFDRHFQPKIRIENETPRKAVILDGIRLHKDDAPYFTTSHAYNSNPNNRSGVVAYRTLAGDLALFDVSEPSRSSVLLMSEDWDLTTQTLVEYNKSGAGVVVSDSRMGGRMPGGWWSSDGETGNGVGLNKFDVFVHSDFGGEVLFVEIEGKKEESKGDPYDGKSLLKAAQNLLPMSEVNDAWRPTVSRQRNLGLVLSLKPDSFGQPIAAVSLPVNGFPFAEYSLNTYYITGVLAKSKQFAFMRFARNDMETVCSLRSISKESGNESGLYWPLPTFIPEVVLMDLDQMGLVDFKPNYSIMLDTNLDIHIQPDRAGDLVFVATGSGVTAYDVTRVSKYSGLVVVKTYWWRKQGQMRIIVPDPMEPYHRDEELWAYPFRTETGAIIAPSVPRIWKSFLPGKLYGYGEGDEEMLTIVRSYNYAYERICQHGMNGERSREVPHWQRPDFLVAWEIPLTRKGCEEYTADKLNQRLGFGKGYIPDYDAEKKADAYMEHANGIYPSRIMELHNSMVENLVALMRCFENHPVQALLMPRMVFARRNTHKTLPRWLNIQNNKIIIDKYEYNTLVGPVSRDKWRVKVTPNGALEIQRRQLKREMITLNLNRTMICERPCPQTIVQPKRFGGVLSGLWGKKGGERVMGETRRLKDGVEELLTGPIHHIKAGHSGDYLAYVTQASVRGDAGSLVVVKYD